ncbi:hypothetical protein [Mesorhizobium sp. M0698]|uniref:hypothetical protein n=1 Tax=Mesorhizobium sp. M0698 TaxID=2956987 RepID=UPI00333E049A
MADWQVVMPEMHLGYIVWARFKVNQEKLTDNAQAYTYTASPAWSGTGRACFRAVSLAAYAASA